MARSKARRFGYGLLAASAVLLAACATGQDAQTANQTPAIDGTNAKVGAMQLHALAIAAPPASTFHTSGSDARLQVVIVNTGTKPDTLTGVTSPVASAWGVYGSDSAASAVEAAASGAAAASASATPTQSLQVGQTSVPVEADGTASFGVPNATSVMLLLNLTADLHTGSSYPITFTFANAGSVTVSVPVALTPPGSVPGSTIPVELGTAAN